MYNVRPGNEPSRMCLGHWDDAINKRWLQREHLDHLDPVDRAMCSDNLICHMPDKGNKMVPLIILKDCIEGLKILCDSPSRVMLAFCQNIRTNMCLLTPAIHPIMSWGGTAFDKCVWMQASRTLSSSPPPEVPYKHQICHSRHP